MIFADREEAGTALANDLLNNSMINKTLSNQRLVLSIPRGGVVVGSIIAQALTCVHDVIISKKISFPRQPEAAIGAIAEDGPAILHDQLPNWFLQQVDYLNLQKTITQEKVRAYINKFRGGRSLVVRGKTVILVDDGIATGQTMKAAILWLKAKAVPERPKSIIVAAPVCSPRVIEAIDPLVDNMVYLAAPDYFFAVGQFYHNFRQVSDDDVIHILPAALSQKAA